MRDSSPVHSVLFLGSATKFSLSGKDTIDPQKRFWVLEAAEIPVAEKLYVNYLFGLHIFMLDIIVFRLGD